MPAVTLSLADVNVLLAGPANTVNKVH